MDDLTSLDVALDRLLHRRSFRRALAAGALSLRLSDEDRDALSSLDLAALESTANAMCVELFHRAHRGVGTLASLFPSAVAQWREEHPDDASLAELAAEFMESGLFDRYREHSHAGPARCLEQCFYDYCEARSLGEPVRREREGLSAMIRAIATSADGSIVAHEAVHRAPRGWFAVTARDVPTLYATLDGKILQGPITPLLRAILLGTEAREALCQRYGDAVVKENRRALVALGLLDQ